MIDHNQAVADQEAPKSTELSEVIVEFGRHLDMLAEQLGTSLIATAFPWVNRSTSLRPRRPR
jgi:hypothetical protein